MGYGGGGNNFCRRAKETAKFLLLKVNDTKRLERGGVGDIRGKHYGHFHI